jgi:hypothetical protein
VCAPLHADIASRALQFNPVEENLLATGSADRNVVLHDMRYLSQRLHCMQAHREEVFQACCTFCSPAHPCYAGRSARLPSG